MAEKGSTSKQEEGIVEGVSFADRVKEAGFDPFGKGIGCWGSYEPFDEELHKTDLTEYKIPLALKYGDRFATRIDKGAVASPEDLPPTYCGLCCSFTVAIVVMLLAGNSISKLWSDDTSLVAWGAMYMNVDVVCGQLNGFSSAALNSSTWPITAGNSNDLDIPGCDVDERYTPQGIFEEVEEEPMLDLPALNFEMRQHIEFYEEDGRSSVGKIEWKHKEGVHFGMTSNQADIPVAFGAAESVPVMLGSFRRVRATWSRRPRI
jgi:hypothetical protein